MLEFDFGNRIITDKELFSLSNQAITALLARAALRKFPQLADNKIIKRDKVKAKKYFLAIEFSIHAAILATTKPTLIEIVQKASKKTLEVREDDIYINGIVTLAVSAVAPLLSNTGLKLVDEALDKEYDETLHFLIKTDFDFLIETNDKLEKDGKSIYETPIWPCGKTDEWKTKEKSFKSLTKKLMIPDLYQRYKSGGEAYLTFPLNIQL